MDFRIFLILIYFNTVNDQYSYSDIVELLGITYKQLNIFLEDILNNEFMVYNDFKVLSLTEKGKELLGEKGFDCIDIYKLYEKSNDENIFNSKKIDINDIYTPERFTKKFKGYKCAGSSLEIG